jgi:hypothetical protein
VEQQWFVISDELRIESESARDYIERRTDTVDTVRYFIHPRADLIVRDHIVVSLSPAR